MKAFILAAGKGTRMHPFTHVTPKPLLLIKNKPLIEYHIINLKASGITEIVINVHHLGDRIKHYLGDGSKYDLDIKYSEEEHLLDTGGGICNALELLGEEPFIVVSSDIYTNYDFSNLPKSINGLAHLVLVNNPSFKPNGDFSLQGNKVKFPELKTYTYANIAILKPELFYDISDRVFPLYKLLKNAIEKNAVTGEIFTGNWFNIGTPSQLIEAGLLI